MVRGSTPIRERVLDKGSDCLPLSCKDQPRGGFLIVSWSLDGGNSKFKLLCGHDGRNPHPLSNIL